MAPPWCNSKPYTFKNFIFRQLLIVGSNFDVFCTKTKYLVTLFFAISRIHLICTGKFHPPQRALCWRHYSYREWFWARCWLLARRPDCEFKKNSSDIFGRTAMCETKSCCIFSSSVKIVFVLGSEMVEIVHEFGIIRATAGHQIFSSDGWPKNFLFFMYESFRKRFSKCVSSSHLDSWFRWNYFYR